MAADRRRSSPPLSAVPAAPQTAPAPHTPSPAPALAVVPGGGLLRWSRIRDVRARILAGYYDRDDVRSRLADAVLRRMPRR